MRLPAAHQGLVRGQLRLARFELHDHRARARIRAVGASRARRR